MVLCGLFKFIVKIVILAYGSSNEEAINFCDILENTMIEVIAMAIPAGTVNSSKRLSIKKQTDSYEREDGQECCKNSIDMFEKYQIKKYYQI